MDSLHPKDLPVPVAHPQDDGRPHECTKRRLLRGLGIAAVCLWLGARYGHIAARYVHIATPVRFPHFKLPWPIPSDVSVERCAAWSDIREAGASADGDEPFPYAADASFALPVSADTLFLLSRSIGRDVLAAGRVDYVQSADVSDTVQVDITARFWHEEHLDGAKTCLLARDGAWQTGVGIFTNWQGEGRRDKHDKMHFEVTVTLPQAADHGILRINNLSTDLQIFSQIFGDMNNVAFKSLALKSSLGMIMAESLSTGNASLHTSLGAIRLQSLTAESADVETSMGSIEGRFNASNTLTLRNANGPIIVDVNLATDAGGPAKLHMQTSNGPIEGNITLISSKASDASTFDVTARTSNGRMLLAVRSAPVDAKITLRAMTSLGAVSVSLPATYEGAFRAATSLAAVVVAVDEKAADPAGRGRARQVEYDGKGRGSASGHVGWSEPGMRRGSVSIGTSLAPVTLEL
ncbi:hypothetical protein DFH09DRAFT_1309531 [Mycena vulgaris]|nr:hypothetical protein DFH09DRAFT_1309531 [Mycena vulgaris]